MIAIVAAFALLVVVLVAQLTSRNAPGTESLPSASTSPAPRKSPAEGPFVKREPNDAKAMGDVDAPVVLVEWTDLRCPFCAAFSRDTLPAVIDEYVKAGKVRLEVHDVALFGSQSEEASVAAHAAAEQGRYFEYLHAVNAAAPEKGHPDLPRQELIAFARTAGVPDMEKFTTDLDSPKIRPECSKALPTHNSSASTASRSSSQATWPSPARSRPLCSASTSTMLSRRRSSGWESDSSVPWSANC